MTERRSHAQENPFSSQMSGYGVFDGNKLQSVYPPNSKMHTFHQESYQYFRDLVLNPDFACLAGQGAVRGNRHVFSAYPDMTSPEVAEGVSHDLLRFKKEFNLANADKPVSFIATFEQPKSEDQLKGAHHLYKLLGNMHKHDKDKGYDWNDKVSRDINSPNFGYSSSGDAFFITYLYEHASSQARKSEIPLVLFTAHATLEQLKRKQILEKLTAFDKLKGKIRERQGESVHPHSGDHGVVNEFRQYALVDPDEATQQRNEKTIYDALGGKCPFGHDKKEE